MGKLSKKLIFSSALGMSIACLADNSAKCPANLKETVVYGRDASGKLDKSKFIKITKTKINGQDLISFDQCLEAKPVNTCQHFSRSNVYPLFKYNDVSRIYKSKIKLSRIGLAVAGTLYIPALLGVGMSELVGQGGVKSGLVPKSNYQSVHRENMAILTAPRDFQASKTLASNELKILDSVFKACGVVETDSNINDVWSDFSEGFNSLKDKAYIWKEDGDMHNADENSAGHN